MALGTDYARQDCSLARALEAIGERWTLLILRDCFFGVRRFTDLQDHLDISKAVLTQRLSTLVDTGLLEKSGGHKHGEYTLTEDAIALWPAMFALIKWGEQRWSPRGPRRIFSHAVCETDIATSGQCPTCGTIPPPGELQIRPGPGADPSVRSDPVSVALRSPRLLLQPLPVQR
ncbi:helix-turn-helix domain-containing protein [Antrihabitans sp. YC2-6]|uniref:winged helix-turn-helix transcriptional regulator n=1 Tax=Antrihabitans sp. YC2-6 TaxID=2799498 RepID=UPI0018F29553|nr:helix-turn-helix domain-containing protein [Antrihabitans sp. YC2-6]MBJ8344843.1 helix-turn-helix transcriptional regulator [Antrihabitans sp. YC2-6]